uniref:Troponin-C isoform 6x n=1 Tax=Homarus americanus TaxID=6706 RepID=C7EA12_HOMAM|nr:troponin-C isoform 6x [Homarus americanus]
MPGPTEELDEEKMAMLRKAFAMFDSGKTGKIEKEKIRTILNTLGANYINEELEALLVDNDLDGTGKLDFDSFVRVVGHSLSLSLSPTSHPLSFPCCSLPPTPSPPYSFSLLPLLFNLPSTSKLFSPPPPPHLSLPPYPTLPFLFPSSRLSPAPR